MEIKYNKATGKDVQAIINIQYVLGIIDIWKFTNLSMKELLNMAVNVKRNFNKVIENLQITESNISLV